jgi:hypothetical protein
MNQLETERIKSKILENSRLIKEQHTLPKIERNHDFITGLKQKNTVLSRWVKEDGFK